MNKFISILLFCFIMLDADKIYSQAFSNQKKLQTASNMVKGALQIPNENELISFKNIFRPGIQISSFNIESSTLFSKNLYGNDFLTAQNIFQSSTKSQMGIEVSSIPILVQFTRQDGNSFMYGGSEKNWVSLNFDVEKYKDKWKKLAGKLGPESLSKFGEQSAALRKTIIEKLKTDLTENVESKLKSTLDSISGGINPLELEGKSIQELSSIFFGVDVDLIRVGLDTKIEEVRNQNLVTKVKDSLLNDLLNKKDLVEKKCKYIRKVENVIKKAKSSGILDMMNTLNIKSKEDLDELMKNPELLAKTVASKYKLGGLPKILSLLSQFKAGGQTLPFSNNPATSFLAKGVSFEFKIKDKFIGFSTGKLFPVFNNFSLANFSGNNDSARLSNNQSPYWSLHFRKGPEENNHKGIKLTSITSETTGSNNIGITGLSPKNILIVNLYSKEQIFHNNWLKTEITKSIVQKINGISINSATGIREDKTSDLLTLNNLAIKVAFDGRFEEVGITHQVHFKKSFGATGEANNNYLTSGGYEAGFSARMKRRENKFSYMLKANVRKYNIPGSLESSWRSADIRTRISYKMKKGQSLQFSTLFHEGYKNYLSGQVFRTIKQNSNGFSCDINLVNKRIFGLYNTSFISTGFQKDYFPVLSTTTAGKILTSNSYNILLNQTFLYGDHLLTFNSFYTKVSQDINTYFYNTKLDLDAGGHFKINSKLNIGASLVYGYFKDAYTNIGVKASVTAYAFKNFQIDFNTDLRKNIQLINPLFDQFINMNCILKYTIK